MLLIRAVELVHPDMSGPIALTTDASKTVIGGVLEQYVDNRWEPLGFCSKSLKQNQQGWTTFRRELFAIQQSTRHFLPEFDGCHLVVYTDHRALIGAFKNPSSQAHDTIASNQISENCQWTNDVRFLEGKSNVVADWLSRPPEVPLGTAYQLHEREEIATMESEGVALEVVSNAQLATE